MGSGVSERGGRWRLLLLVGFGVTAIVAAGIFVNRLPDPVVEARRQTAQEEVPGSLTLSLGAVPKGFKPGITEDEAFRLAWDRPVKTTTYLTLAVMQDSYYGSDDIPDWVFVSRKRCYFVAKGDLVSPARSGAPDGGCTDSNLALVAVDAVTGEKAEAFSGYDERQDWLPINANPNFTFEQMQAAEAEREG